MKEQHAVLVVYGSCAEAIDVAPVILELRRCHWIRPVVGVLGTGDEMVHEVQRLFEIVPDIDLDVAGPGASISDVLRHIEAGHTASLEQSAAYLEVYGIDAVVVDGGSGLSFAVAMLAFHGGLPVIHLNAGIHGTTIEGQVAAGNTSQLISQVASLHLVPTANERSTLLDAGIDPEDIVVTGRSAVDSRMGSAVNPFGDGRAAARIRAAVEELLGVGRRLPDFDRIHQMR